MTSEITCREEDNKSADVCQREHDREDSNDEEKDADHRHKEPGDEQKTFFSRNRFKKLFF